MSAAVCLKSTAGRLAPGRPFTGSLPRRIRWRTRFGNPPGGCPIRPLTRSMTDSGKAISRFSSSTSWVERLLATRNRARSPTDFDVGVTLTMSPRSWFTSA